jgi:hypothetical protein
MRSVVTCLVCGLVVFGLAVSTVQAGEKVDNPLYKHWAKFKPGAFAQVKTENEAMGQKTVMTVTWTLKELTPEKAIIEMSAVNVMSGNEMKMPPQKQEVLAKVEEEKAKELDTPKKGDKKNGAEVLNVGEEEIKVGDKKIKCKWIETKMKQDDQTILSKAWTSDEIPGMVVKTSMTVEGKTKMKSEGLVVKFSVDGKSEMDNTGKAEKTDKADKAEKSEPSKKDDAKGKAEKSDKPETKDQKDKK